MRKPLLAANWKMNKTAAEACAWLRDFVPEIKGQEETVELAVCAPFTALWPLNQERERLEAGGLLALVPGTSRSGATILGAMILGCSRGAAAEFSFFLGVPVMFGASFLRLVKYGFHFTGAEVFILIFGMVVAFLVSVYSIKFLMSYIRRNDFKLFGYYRIVLGVIVLIYFGVRAILSLM